jgi:Arc/MetJ-type ribon-helix-helix transcriptional regulator
MTRSLTVDLPDDVAADIEHRVRCGEFGSPGQLISAALALLREGSAAYWQSIEDASQAGFAELDRGDSFEGSPAFYEEIRDLVTSIAR